jgi:uncharacterized protein (DUF952 family)
MAIFHLLLRAEWERALADGRYVPPSLAELGFIHFCEDRQLLATAARWFPGRHDLMVLSVREDRVGAEVRREPVDGDLFPHLYGPLPLEAVVEALPMPLGPDGFELPETFRPRAPHVGVRQR